MRYKNKPNWIAAEEDAAQLEMARRIERKLTGKRCPKRESVVEKMRKDYAKYGKKNINK